MPGRVTKASPFVISSGAGANQYALEVDITVDEASSLAGHYGDVLQGLRTGLTGDLSATPVEGLSIVVTLADGTPVVGSWEATVPVAERHSSPIPQNNPTACRSLLRSQTSRARHNSSRRNRRAEPAGQDRQERIERN